MTGGLPATDGPADPANPARRPGADLNVTASFVVTLMVRVPTQCLALGVVECKRPDGRRERARIGARTHAAGGRRLDTGSMTTYDAPTAGRELRTAAPRQLDWLRGEIEEWDRTGRLEPGQAEALLGLYRSGRRLSVGRLLLGLGTGFVGVGLVWLVASNLDQLAPLARFVLLTAIWLGLLVGGEVLAARVPGRSVASRGLVVAVRTLAALALGAVVFQAGQSLQVPADEPALVGWWAAGALLQAYAVRSFGPLLVGSLAGVTWFLWAVLETEPSGLAVVLALLAGAVVATGVAAAHAKRLPPELGDLWRELGALLALTGLFAAALPFVTPDDFAWDPYLVAGLVAAAVAVAAGTVLGRGTDRLEPLGAVGVAALALLLVAWDTGPETDAALTTGDWLHAVVSVVVYVVVAVGVAVLGTLRDSWPLRALATTGIVLFTTFQSFAVFARIIDGAWLFLVLGLVLLGTGVLFDRTRRTVVAAIGTEEGSS